ncbi:hypothetical protein D8Y20_06680 [Mariprofundus sp. EBB-1]|uniref:hypothetical protein n=1 Tax=Mariprofundus sp. EBB-1 TaxID=2650971 RepID=UPI000EF2330A|nr:hypothetical protein [Mariprofundus sp. EBB-1]RLL52692.1 hypothetical protein D8Y20_06680 [Mariprofundus sp. EBB-1]
MSRLLFIFITTALLISCSFDPIRIDLAGGWSVKSLVAFRHTNPQSITASKDGKWLYISLENSAGLSTPSLATINMATGHHQILLNGLHLAHGLQIAPDTSLWIGEQFEQGMIWRISEPGKLPEDQRIERTTLAVTHPSIAPLPAAGRFTHSGFAFSQDGRFAYMAGADSQGRLYRYTLRSRKLQVLHAQEGWLSITNPESADAEATHLKARAFTPLRGVTVLPNGHILIAEPAKGRLLELDDSSEHPELSTYLDDAELQQPVDLAWDTARQWLWISDGYKPSRLWAYDGNRLNRIASHKEARITGLAVHGETVYLNLRDNGQSPEITLKLTETDTP